MRNAKNAGELNFSFRSVINSRFATTSDRTARGKRSVTVGVYAWKNAR